VNSIANADRWDDVDRNADQKSALRLLLDFHRLHVQQTFVGTRAVSSAVEHRPYKPGVAGSKPAPPTNKIKDFLLFMRTRAVDRTQFRAS
jgi:hypothetical protein